MGAHRPAAESGVRATLNPGFASTDIVARDGITNDCCGYGSEVGTLRAVSVGGVGRRCVRYRHNRVEAQIAQTATAVSVTR